MFFVTVGGEEEHIFMRATSDWGLGKALTLDTLRFKAIISLFIDRGPGLPEGELAGKKRPAGMRPASEMESWADGKLWSDVFSYFRRRQSRLLKGCAF